MKNVLLLLLGLASYVPTYGQSWRVAPTLGVNLSTISFSNALLNAQSGGTRITPGLTGRWQLGALVDYGISEQISIRSGLLYSVRGSSLKATTTQSGYSVTSTGSYTMNYLDLPLLVTVAIGQNGLRLVGGPVLGFALGGKFSLDDVTVAGYSYGGGENKLTVGNTTSNSMLPTDFSLSLGLLKQVDINEKTFELGVHVQPSLSSFSPGTRLMPTYTTTHFLIGLKASYFFEVGR